MVPDVTRPTFAHLYLPNGDVEYICMSCLGVVCQVGCAEDSLIYQRTHTCGSQERTVDLRQKVS